MPMTSIDHSENTMLTKCHRFMVDISRTCVKRFTFTYNVRTANMRIWLSGSLLPHKFNVYVFKSQVINIYWSSVSISLHQVVIKSFYFCTNYIEEKKKQLYEAARDYKWTVNKLIEYITIKKGNLCPIIIINIFSCKA